MKQVDISAVKKNPTNPRFIKNDKFKKLVQSIKDFPKMLEIRPIVVNKEMVILGGNMRFEACKQAGLQKVWIKIADELTKEEQQEFIIKDNSSFGEWDWDVLANEWDKEQLDKWGLELKINDQKNDDIYSKKINAPLYEAKKAKPELDSLFDSTKYLHILKSIDENKSLNEKEKYFLKLAATRHIVFDFSKIADYYSHSEKEIQKEFEKSALVIIDYDQAIREGYVELQESVYEQYLEDYG